MKAELEKIVPGEGKTILVAYRMNLPYLEYYWHHHPEYELTFKINIKGKRIVGDSYEDFHPGDLVLIGPDLPHTWVTNRKEKHKNCDFVVIQFSNNLFNSFTHLGEFDRIKRLLQNSKHGLHFKNSKALKEKILGLPEKMGIEKITDLIWILEQLSRQKGRKLASADYEITQAIGREQRINKVCNYLEQHFSKPISIEDAAKIINISKSAFCKFFKRTTGKTFSDYLNEIRIGYACYQLLETDKPIAGIARSAGFDSVSYFNRVFYKKKNSTPREFRSEAA
ncbi:AraC family transcriptional regulator [Lacibacter sp. MH-610]|jgi:AraC-like DNA-binding protein|uniref:AraC family transcriptional regulator n=1 Tax=Lacibacter sp. MH-610 TaxID=3020883 RepID=UPI003892162E